MSPETANPKEKSADVDVGQTLKKVRRTWKDHLIPKFRERERVAQEAVAETNEFKKTLKEHKR